MKRLGIIYMFLLLAGCINAQTKQEIKEAKRLERLKYRHSDWPLCFIIRSGGDTLIVNLKPDYLNDYCTTYGGISFSDNGLKVAYGNGEEQTVHPAEFRELFVYSTKARYLVITGDDKVEYIVRVIAEGKCKLLYRDVAVSYVTSTNNPGGGGSTSRMNNANLGFYYVLYKGKLTRLLSGNQPALIAKTLAKNCTEVFAECPSVIAEINSKTLRREDLPDLVNKFNECVGKK
jgi:hypothetical protein